MIIEIEREAACDESSLEWLDRLLVRVEDGWHVWRVTGIDGFEDTMWLIDPGRSGSRARNLYQAAIKRSGWVSKAVHGRTVRVTLKPTKSSEATELTPPFAARFADKPLRVLVENRRSDGAFLKRVIEELDPVLKKWWNQDPQPVKIDSLGGKGEMETEVERVTSQSPRPRFVVIMDSDRCAPEDSPSREAIAVENLCERHEIPCWVLEKRESENYLPEELLELRRDCGADHVLRIDAWARLSDDQKDFYNMKNGLPDASSNSGSSASGPSVSEARLFEDLGAEDRRTLSGGFGKKVSECWNEYSASMSVSGALRRRGGRDLERGLLLIRMEV